MVTTGPVTSCLLSSVNSTCTHSRIERYTDCGTRRTKGVLGADCAHVELLNGKCVDTRRQNYCSLRLSCDLWPSSKVMVRVEVNIGAGVNSPSLEQTMPGSV